jgi:hypothetical protein
MKGERIDIFSCHASITLVIWFRSDIRAERALASLESREMWVVAHKSCSTTGTSSSIGRYNSQIIDRIS